MTEKTEKVEGRVTLLEAANVKRIRAVTIEPSDGAMTIIGGGNNNGKSSALDALEWALRGMGAVPQEPVRRGAEKAEIELHISGPNGDFVVRRIITPDRKTRFKITRKGEKRGLPAPQSLLDIVECPDPQAFAQLPPRAMAEQLRRLSGVDFGELDRDRADAYAGRTEAGRKAKNLAAQAKAAVVHSDAPAKPVVVAELLEERRRRQTVNGRNDRARSLLEQAQLDVSDLEDEFDRIDRRLSAAREKLAKQEEAAADLVDENLDDIDQKIAGAEAANQKLRDNERAGALQEAADRAARRHREFDQLITKIDAEKARLLAESKLPVKGLEFTDDTVRFRGTPWDQLSQSQQLKVALVVGLLQSPGIPVQVIRNGSLLDDESLAEIAGYAEKKGAQLFVERVGDGDEGAIIIEDGMVRS